MTYPDEPAQPGQPPRQPYESAPPPPMSAQELAAAERMSGGPQIAGMGDRFVGFLIDGVLATAIAAVLLVPGFAMSDPPTIDPDTGVTTGGSISPLVALGYLVAFAFSAYNRWFLLGKTGQSIGNKVMKISVLRAADGRPIGVGMAFVRELILGLTGSLCFIGYLSPFFDSSGKRQGWHDKVASSVVVKV